MLTEVDIAKEMLTGTRRENGTEKTENESENHAKTTIVKGGEKTTEGVEELTGINSLQMRKI